MNLVTAFSAYNALRQAGQQYSNLPTGDVDRLNAITRALAGMPVFENKPDIIKQLVDTSVPLPDRLVSAFSSPELRALKTQLQRENIVYKCHACGILNSHDLESVPDDPMKMLRLVGHGKSILESVRSLSPSGKSLLDNLARQFLPMLLPEDGFAQVREYISKNRDPLHQRIVGALLYPGVREALTQKFSGLVGPRFIVPDELDVICVHCGAERHLVLHEDAA